MIRCFRPRVRSTPEAKDPCDRSSFPQICLDSSVGKRKPSLSFSTNAVRTVNQTPKHHFQLPEDQFRNQTDRLEILAKDLELTHRRNIVLRRFNKSNKDDCTKLLQVLSNISKIRKIAKKQLTWYSEPLWR
jgi:hypothetical protein